MKPVRPPPRLVLVEWEDAAEVDDSTWVHHEDAKPSKAVIFFQVGWIIELTPEAVVLSSCMGEHAMSRRDRIPMGMVRRIAEFDPLGGTPVRIPRKRIVRKK